MARARFYLQLSGWKCRYILMLNHTQQYYLKKRSCIHLRRLVNLSSKYSWIGIEYYIHENGFIVRKKLKNMIVYLNCNKNKLFFCFFFAIIIYKRSIGCLTMHIIVAKTIILCGM